MQTTKRFSDWLEAIFGQINRCNSNPRCQDGHRLVAGGLGGTYIEKQCMLRFFNRYCSCSSWIQNYNKGVGMICKVSTHTSWLGKYECTLDFNGFHDKTQYNQPNMKWKPVEATETRSKVEVKLEHQRVAMKHIPRGVQTCLPVDTAQQPSIRFRLLPGRPSP